MPEIERCRMIYPVFCFCREPVFYLALFTLPYFNSMALNVEHITAF